MLQVNISQVKIFLGRLILSVSLRINLNLILTCKIYIEELPGHINFYLVRDLPKVFEVAKWKYHLEFGSLHLLYVSMSLHRTLGNSKQIATATSATAAGSKKAQKLT